MNLKLIKNLIFIKMYIIIINKNKNHQTNNMMIFKKIYHNFKILIKILINHNNNYLLI